MAIQEIRDIKESLSEKLWGKTACEINEMIKPSVDEMMAQIDKMRLVKSRKTAQGQS